MKKIVSIVLVLTAITVVYGAGLQLNVGGFDLLKVQFDVSPFSRGGGYVTTPPTVVPYTQPVVYNKPVEQKKSDQIIVNNSQNVTIVTQSTDKKSFKDNSYRDYTYPSTYYYTYPNYNYYHQYYRGYYYQYPRVYHHRYYGRRYYW